MTGKSMPLPPSNLGGIATKLPSVPRRNDDMIPLDDQAKEVVVHVEKRGIVDIDLSLVYPSPYQPRFLFDEEKIAELAESISVTGQVTPIIVRAMPDGRYELIGGERRTRAMRMLKKPTIEAVIRNISDDEAAVLAIVDNESRENLTDYERGKGYKRLIDEGRVGNQTQLALQIGKSNSTITRCLSYFKLPVQVIRMLDDKPDLLGNKVVADFARLTELGFGEVVTRHVDTISKGKYSQEVALNYAKSEVDHLTGKKVAKTAPKKLLSSGRPVAEFRFEGKRDVVLRCERDVDPSLLISKLEELLAKEPMVFHGENTNDSNK